MRRDKAPNATTAAHALKHMQAMGEFGRGTCGTGVDTSMAVLVD